MAKSFFSRVALAFTGALYMIGTAQAFDAGIDIDLVAAPNGATATYPNCLGAFFGRALNTRIQAYYSQNTLVGGGYWDANADTITSSGPVTAAMLSPCGYTDPVIISQTGPSGATYAADDYIGITWRASELGGSDVYQYEFAISGATGTTFINTRTLIASRPTVSVSADKATLNASQTATITFTFDQTVTLANAGAISASGGTLGALSGSGTSYWATFTPTLNATTTGSVSVGNGAFEAGAGLTNQDAADANNAVSIAVDTVAPGANLTDFVVTTGPPVPGWYGTTLTLSEPSPNFSFNDIQLSSNVTGWGYDDSAAPVYKIYISPPSGNGPVTLSIPAGVFTDAAGNLNTASREIIYIQDTTPPTVSIADFTGALNGPQTAIITLSEASTDFDAGDLTLTNATVTLTGSGTSYTAVLTPIAEGPVALSVAANTFTDAAGNQNTASNEVTTTFDSTAPTVSIAAFTGPANGDQTAIITLSEASTDFDAGDLTLTNATATLTGSGTSYTAVLTPTADGPVALSVAANTFTDAAGNQNTASNEVTATADMTEPGVLLTTTQTLISGATTFDVTITFSEVVTGFGAGDIAVTNGSVTGFTGSGADYVATVGATGGGDAGISVPAAAAEDAAGNPNMASNLLTISSATVEQTQDVIARFMQTRANMLISSQPDLTDFLASGSGQGSFDGQATDDGGSFNFASATDSHTSLWMRLNGTWVNEDSSESQYLFGVFGGHFSISPNILIGGMVEFDHLGQNDGNAHIEGQGWMAGPYFVARLPNQPLFFEGRLLYGRTSNEVSPFGTYTDRFDTERMLAMAKVAGKLAYGATTLTPSLQFSHTTDDQKAYTDSLANFIPKQGIALGQLELGVDFSRLIALTDAAGTLELTGGIAAIGSWTRGTGHAGQIVPEYEGRRAKVKLGVNYTMANGGAFMLDGIYDGIGTAGFEAIGLKAGFNLAF